MATPDQQYQSMLENLPARTGKSLADWLGVLGGSGLEKHGQLVAHLKTEHGVTHGFANLIVTEFRNRGAGSGDDPVAAQYSGAKEGLRPMYDAVIAEVGKFGRDVEIAPKKSYVSLRRRRQFGLVQPSTRTRVDVGLNLPGVEPAGRLETSGSFNAMVTHRVRVADPGDVDRELIGWLREAYERAG